LWDKYDENLASCDSNTNCSDTRLSFQDRRCGSSVFQRWVPLLGGRHKIARLNAACASRSPASELADLIDLGDTPAVLPDDLIDLSDTLGFAFAPNGDFCVGGSDRSVRVWSPDIRIAGCVAVLHGGGALEPSAPLSQPAHSLERQKNNFLDLLSDAPCGNTPDNENDLLGDCLLDDAIVVKGRGNINNGSVCTGACLGARDAAIDENRSEVVDLLACHVWDHAMAPGNRVDIEDKDFLTDWPCDDVLSTCH